MYWPRIYLRPDFQQTNTIVCPENHQDHANPFWLRSAFVCMCRSRSVPLPPLKHRRCGPVLCRLRSALPQCRSARLKEHLYTYSHVPIRMSFSRLPPLSFSLMAAWPLTASASTPRSFVPLEWTN